ncbi:MAG TPA: hypothetical protein VNW47_11905 [Terriglobales bacterium]|nr:hypothetical protein [Terriglobales bacterium]
MTTRTWYDFALPVVLVGVYVWLRVWSGWWPNRWIGFAFGAVVAVVMLVRSRGWAGSPILSNGVYLRMSLLSFALMIWGFANFFRSADGSDGFFAFLMLTFGVQSAYMYRWVPKQDRLPTTKGSQEYRNHG